MSYSHKDTSLIQEIMAFIRRPIEEVGGIFWTDRDIEWGALWDNEIRAKLQSADIALVMVSQNFLSSDYIRSVEVKEFLNRRKNEGLIILPILIAPSLWDDYEWLRNTQAFPRDGRYIKGRRNREALYVEIATGLKGAVLNLAQQSTLESTDEHLSAKHIFGFLNTEDHSKRWPLIGSEIRIGRDFNNHIAFEKIKAISRFHAVIHHSQSVSIIDKNSLNGTYVNGIRLRPNEPTSISQGTRISLANKIDLIYEVFIPRKPDSISETEAIPEK